MRNLNRAFALVVGAVAVAVCVGTAAAAGAPAKSAAAAPVAQKAPGDDPAKVETSREFLIAFRTQLDPKNVAVSVDRRIAVMVAHEKKENPKLDTKKFEEEARDRLMGAALKNLDLQARVVSRHFTLQELKDLAAFFHGPLGGKLAAETPKIIRDVMMEKRKENPLGGLEIEDETSTKKPAQQKK